MDEPLTQTDMNIFYEQLQGQLDELRERLTEIKNESRGNLTKAEENKLTEDLIRHNATKRGISVKAYLEDQVKDEPSKIRFLKLCNADDIITPDEMIINEDGNVYRVSIHKSTDFSIPKIGFKTVTKGDGF